MFTLRIKNPSGDEITLTQNESVYQVINVIGIDPPKSNITTVQIAGMDGAKWKHSKMDVRNIVITVKINGDVEANRQSLYAFFRAGKQCTVRFTNANRDVFTEGYCETIDVPLFANDEQMQVSILCTDPYLKSWHTILSDISHVFSAFEFPFSIAEEGIVFSGLDSNREVEIVNQSEIEGGMTITLTGLADGITRPIVYDSDTGQFVALNLTINEGDTVIVNTNSGQKSVRRIVDGIESNAIGSLDSRSMWLQLKVGLNHFTYTAGNADALKVEISHRILYEGV